MQKIYHFITCSHEFILWKGFMSKNEVKFEILKSGHFTVTLNVKEHTFSTP